MSFEGPFKPNKQEEPTEPVHEVASTLEKLQALTDQLDTPREPGEYTPEEEAGLKEVIDSLREKE